MATFVVTSAAALTPRLVKRMGIAKVCAEFATLVNALIVASTATVSQAKFVQGIVVNPAVFVWWMETVAVSAARASTTNVHLRACVGDEYDLRLGSPQLAPRTYTNMVLCDDDVDVYRIEIGPNEGVSARISHEPGAGDIMLTLRSLDEEAVGVSEAGVARAGLLARGLPRMIDIIISGRPGSTTAYTLDLRIQSAAVCAPDNFEPPLGNASQDQPQQTLGQAPPLVSRLCQGDADWFAVTVPGGVTLTTTLSSDRLNAVEATLLDALGRPGPDFENTGRDKRA